MGIQIQTALDSLKRQSLLVIMENVFVRSPNLKTVLFDYIKNGKGVFEGLLNFLDFRGASFSSDYINSAMLLAYMDFYAIYTLTYSNYAVFESLKDISNAKFSYIYNMYRDSYNVLNEKQFSADYKFVKYVNFGLPKDIDVARSRTNVRSKNVADLLRVDAGALTLPTSSYKEIYPAAISFDIKETANHIVEQDTGNDYLTVRILRKHSEKLGMLKLSDPNLIIHRYEGEKDNTSGYTLVPDVFGTVYGHFTKELHIMVYDLVLNSDGTVAQIYLVGSSNGYEWSAPFAGYPGYPISILIERDIEIGLNITLQDGFGLEIQDRWIISLHDIKLPDPKLAIKFGFGMLEAVSFIKYNDVSPYKLTIEKDSQAIGRLKYDNRKSVPAIFDNRIAHFFMAEGPVNYASAVYSQADYDLSSKNGSLYHKYSFMINDITGVVAEYKQHGSISIKAMPVENVGSLSLVTNYHIPSGEDLHSIEDPHPDTCYTEFNVFVENELGKVVIPILDKNFVTKKRIKKMFRKINIIENDPTDNDVAAEPSDTLIFSTATKKYHYLDKVKNLTYFPEFALDNLPGDLFVSEYTKKTYIMNKNRELKYHMGNLGDYIPMIFEYIIPTDINVNGMEDLVGLAHYQQRFPIDNSYVIDGEHKYMKTYNISTRSEATCGYDEKSNNMLIYDYRLRYGYTVWYPLRINKMIDTATTSLKLEKLWALKNDGSVIAGSSQTAGMDFKMSGTAFSYVGDNIGSSFKLSVYDSQGNRIATEVTLQIQSGNARFGSSTTKTVVTSASEDLVVPLTITGDGEIRFLTSSGGSGWINSGHNIYHMYYLDENNEVHVAIRTLNKSTGLLEPFSGNLELALELRSVDKIYATPVVFDMGLLCI